MDSNLNYRHAQTHAADLHRRAELHRLAATARASERGARPTRPSRRPLGSLTGSLTGAFRKTVARVSAAFASVR
jgi:hypothetical protein